MDAILALKDVTKTFTLHLQNGTELPVLRQVSFAVAPERCAVLSGPSGIGKSSILRMVYGNYGVDAGQILVRHDGREVDIATADPRLMLHVRSQTIAYVSQFLRAIPRVSALDVVAEPLVARGAGPEEARDAAAEMLARLNLPMRLWSLPPSTFSGGEQQRVNIARGFLTDHPLLLLDEPTASLDDRNRDVVIDMIHSKREAGTAILGIFHDTAVRERVATQFIDVGAFSPTRSAA